MTLPVKFHGVEHKPGAFVWSGLRLFVLISANISQSKAGRRVNGIFRDWIAFVASMRPGFIQLIHCVIAWMSRRTTPCPLEAAEECEWAKPK